MTTYGIDRSASAGSGGSTIPPFPSLVDPNQDRIIFWDDSAGDFAFMPDATVPGYAIQSNAAGVLSWGPAGGEESKRRITQSTHGFSVGNVLYHTGTLFAVADKDSVTTAEVVGIVDEVVDTNTFTLLYGGYIDSLSGLTAGAVYFLGDSGALTATEPSTVGQITKPLLIATSTTAGYFVNWRGSIVGTASSTLSVENFSGNASTVNFTLTSSPLENNTFVMVEGVYQQKNTYSISGTTLTFSTAPPTGTNNIEVVTVGSVNIGTPSDSTVGQAKLDSTLLAAWPDGLNTQVGLLIKNDGTNPNYQLRITCTEIVLKDTSNLPRKFSSWSSALVDITASGAAGLDTGAEATSTWYYIWLIAKEDGTKSQILSASATSPTLPSGYTYKARVGAIYNKSSGHFAVVRQYGRYVLLVPDAAGSYWNLLSAGTATSWTDLSSTLTTLVPSIAESYALHADNSAGASATYLGLESGGVTPGTDYQALKGVTAAAGHDNWLPNTQVIFYAQSTANAGYLAVNSYRL